MGIKKKHTIRSFEENEAPFLDEEISTIYRAKLESQNYKDSATERLVNYQSIESGRFSTSANASHANTVIVTPVGTYDEILFAKGQARQVDIGVSVTDMTNTAITMSIYVTGTSTLISSVTTASFVVDWMLLGSNP